MNMKLPRNSIIILTLYTLLFVTAYNFTYNYLSSHWDNGLKQETRKVR
jgi:hypothetical protein